MKKIIMCISIISAFMSCNISQNKSIKENIEVEFGVGIPSTGSRNLTTLVNPKISYTITKGSEIYMTAENIPLVKTSGAYSLKISLDTGNSYSFTKFSIKDDNFAQVYKLDIIRTASFTVAENGVVTPDPAQIYLNYQLKDEFTDTTQENKGFLLVDNYKLPENLTFKVLIPAGLTVSVEHLGDYGSNWSNIDAPILLNDGDIYDMDTRHLEGATIVSNDNSVTSYAFFNSSDNKYYSDSTKVIDSFRFKVTKGLGTDIRTYYIYFNSAQYNKKRIQFNIGS